MRGGERTRSPPGASVRQSKEVGKGLPSSRVAPSARVERSVCGGGVLLLC